MGHDRPTNDNANAHKRRPDPATTSPAGNKNTDQASTSAQAPHNPSQADFPARSAPQTLVTGLTDTPAENDGCGPSEATLEDVRIWNREWFENLTFKLWHRTRPLPKYDESELFVYYANANFNRIVRHRYEESAFPAPLSMSDSGAEASHWSMPSIARFDNRAQPRHDLSLDELPDYETWLRGLENLGGPDALNERPSLAVLASRIDDVRRSTAPRDLAMGFEAVTAPAENVGPDSSVVGGGSNESTNKEVTEKNLDSTPQPPKERSPSREVTVSIPPAAINVPHMYQQANYDEDPTIYGLERYLRMLMEPLSPRESPNASIRMATMSEQQNRSSQEIVEQSGSLFILDSSPGEATVYDVETHAFYDSVQTTLKQLHANLPWRYPQPMSVIGEVTEEMISAVSSEWSRESASVSNIVAEPFAASEPFQPVEPNAESPSMTRQFVLDNTLTLEEAAMAPFCQSLSPVRSVSGDRIFVEYPQAFYKELPDSEDDSMCDDDAQPMQLHDGVLKEVAAESNGTQMSQSPAVNEEDMDTDENASSKDDEDVVSPISCNMSVSDQMMDGTQESGNQSDESMKTDDRTPMELDIVVLDDVDDQESENDVCDSIQKIVAEASNDTSGCDLKLDETQKSGDTEDDHLTMKAANESEALKMLQNAYGSSEEDEDINAGPNNAPESVSQSDVSMRTDDGMPMDVDTAVFDEGHHESREVSTSRENATLEQASGTIQKSGDTEDDAATMLKESGGLKVPQSNVESINWNRDGFLESAGSSNDPEVPQDVQDEDDFDTNTTDEDPKLTFNVNGIEWNRPGTVKKAGPSNISEVPAVDDRDADINMDDSEEDDDEPSSSGNSSSDSGTVEVESASATGSEGYKGDLESDATSRMESRNGTKAARKPKSGTKTKSTRSRPCQIVSSCTQTVDIQDMPSVPHCPTCQCGEHHNTSMDQVALAYREWEDAAFEPIRGGLSDEEFGSNHGDEDEMQSQDGDRSFDEHRREQMSSNDPKITRLLAHLDGLVQQCKRLMQALESARSGSNDSLEALQMDEARRLADVEAQIAAEMTDGTHDLQQRLITSSDNLSDSSIAVRQELTDMDVTPPPLAEVDHLDGQIVDDINLAEYELDTFFDGTPASPMSPQFNQEDGHQFDGNQFDFDRMPEHEVVPLEDDESMFNISNSDDSECILLASPPTNEPVSDASSIVNPADLASSDEEESRPIPQPQPRDEPMEVDDDDDDQPRRNRRAPRIVNLESSDEDMEVDSSDDSDDDDQPRRNRRGPRMVYVRPPNRRQRRAAPYMVPQPRRNRGRRSRPINLEFGNLRHISELDGVNLPNAPPVVNMQHLFVVDNTDLSAEQQVMVVSGDHFEAAMYRSGYVVLVGQFDEAPMGSATLRQATEQPVVIWNDLNNPIRSIAAGPNHLIMRSESGRIFTIGQARHGQLGVPNPDRYRQSDLRPDMLLRQVFEGFREVTFSDIRAEGNNSVAITEDGKEYSCGQDYGDIFHRTL